MLVNLVPMNQDFSNLPRNYKMSISSNIYNPGHTEIQFRFVTRKNKRRSEADFPSCGAAYFLFMWS